MVDRHLSRMAMDKLDEAAALADGTTLHLVDSHLGRMVLGFMAALVAKVTAPTASGVGQSQGRGETRR